MKHAAACDVQKAGLSTLVLEAKDRVGGKTWSVTAAQGGIVDLGAAWINDTTQSCMLALAQKLCLDLVQQRAIGNDIHELADGTVKIVLYGGSRVAISSLELHHCGPFHVPCS